MGKQMNSNGKMAHGTRKRAKKEKEKQEALAASKK